MQQIKNKRRARTTVLSATVLCTAIGSAFAVDNEADYNTALATGGTINITGSGFAITAPHMLPTSNVSIAGHNGMPVLNGNGGLYSAFDNTAKDSNGDPVYDPNAPYLTSLKDIAIEGFHAGGVYLRNTAASGNTSDQLSVDNVRFANNTGIYASGGLSADYISDVVNSVFINNTGDAFAGGLDAIVITGSVAGNIFTNNVSVAGFGGAMGIGVLSGSVTNNTFTDNRSNGDGGAMYAFNPRLGSSIADNTFTGNRAVGDGGAIYILDGFLFTASDSTLSDNVFIDNRAQGHGGALAFLKGDSYFITAKIMNNVFLGNRAGGYGGAIFHSAYSNTTNTLTIGADAGKRL